jgi:peptidoglycan/LPS O-acetylase OafA/YrhL
VAAEQEALYGAFPREMRLAPQPSRPILNRGLPVTARSRSLNSLTGLRFIAAAMIVLLHFAGQFGLPPVILGGWPLTGGVSFFFILSGFILTHAHPNMTAGGTPFSFYVSRIARIWPAHVACFLLLFILVQKVPENGTSGSISVALANIFLVQAWIPEKGVFFSFNAVSWSLSAEMFFYALFPLLILNIEKTWTWKFGVTALIVAGAIAYGAHAELAGIDAAWITINPLPRLFEFMFGICLRRFWGRYGDLVPSSIVHATVVELACVGAVVFLGCLFPWLFSQLPQVLHNDTCRIWLMNSGILLLPLAATIFIAASGRGFVSAALGSKPMIVLGEMSFAIYLVHQIVLRAFAQRAAELAVWPPGIALAGYLLLTLLLSTLIWTGVERPARTFIIANYGRLTGGSALWRKPIIGSYTVPLPALERGVAKESSLSIEKPLELWKTPPA